MFHLHPRLPPPREPARRLVKVQSIRKSFATGACHVVDIKVPTCNNNAAVDNIKKGRYFHVLSIFYRLLYKGNGKHFFPY